MSDNATEILADIRKARVDHALPKEEKLPAFVRLIKDPYHYKCGGVTITAQFTKDGPPLTDCVSQMVTI